MFVKAEWMPHRIRITNIKVERLQDISEEDIFRNLIDRISGKGTWQRNPWVFAYEFELIK